MVSKKHSVVFSGSVLGIEEEYSPGSNAFVDDEGNIVSSVSGVALENEKNRTIDVVTRRGVSPMSIGTQIYGRVVLVTDHAAVIEIWDAMKGRVFVAVSSSTSAVPVSKCDLGFVKSIKDKFRLGDFVKARVASVSPWGVDLTTQASDLGVVKAFCTKCRSELHLFGRDLKCLQCGQVEGRKISSEYSLQ
ncbi:MAG: exosome complex RNA-binding protein Csl4 [Candidatus Diapherotrites archaeon]|uniref:Exosome complex component Csl4 n=1 Tax=Candidatus Iainarchaeum sp. TaxID=3101447 RepID=A0A8T4L2Y4_9ARCH|nr:exosome complex RNA-binding protein Csl4 [Candidatus Diapherotrites archaeon]